MAQSSQWDEDDGPPSLKRMRLQTDSIDDVNRYLTRTASSSFDANYANLFGSHGPDDAVSMAQASTLGSGSGLSSSALAGVAGPSTQPYTVESIDVDALPDDTAPVAGPSGTSEAGISLGEAEDVEDEVKTPEKPKHEPLSAYICPICFSPPTNATLTPCGHICCGECLFNAVKATLERGRQHGPAFQNAKWVFVHLSGILFPSWLSRVGRGLFRHYRRTLRLHCGGMWARALDLKDRERQR